MRFIENGNIELRRYLPSTVKRYADVLLAPFNLSPWHETRGAYMGGAIPPAALEIEKK